MGLPGVDLPLLVQVAWEVGTAAVFSFGGLTVVLGELQHDFVGGMGLLSASQFSQTYALSTAAPGPNGPIFMSLLGYQAAGIGGLVACLVGWAVPTLLVLHGLGRLSQVHGHGRIDALLSVLDAGAVGLVAGGVLTMLTAFDWSVPPTAWIQVALAAAGLLALWRGWLSPLVVLIACMALGAFLL